MFFLYFEVVCEKIFINVFLWECRFIWSFMLKILKIYEKFKIGSLRVCYLLYEVEFFKNFVLRRGGV